MKPTARKSQTSSLETKKSLNLTNYTERSQLHRFKLYRDPVLHVKQKEKDRIRKEDSKRSSLQKRMCKFEETLRKRLYRERKKLEKYELEKNDSIDVKMKDKLEKRISSHRNKTRNVSREISTLSD